MTLKHIRTLLALLAMLLILTPTVSAQRIVALKVDSTRCIGDSLTIGIGYSAARDVVVETPSRSVSNSQSTFLCGCDPLNVDTSCTCAFRFPITFQGFNPERVITSVQNIDFVRLNMEHSFHGNLLFALECPNGQFSVMAGSCGYHRTCVDPELESWNQWIGGFCDYFYGEPVDDELHLYGTDGFDPCDTSDDANRPGIGWNYCWTENSDHLIEDVISHNNNKIDVNGHWTIDSTHISSNAHYYPPQFGFNSLIGCPLNGTWNIVVANHQNNSNGYVFEWELAFDIHITSSQINGGDVTHLNDTTIVIIPPTTDTSIDYSLRVTLSSGDIIDTTFSIHWIEPFFDFVDDTLCMGDTAQWHSLEFTSDTTISYHGLSTYGCDSTVDLSYTFMPSYDLHDTLPYCANEQFLYEGVDYGGPCTIVVPHQTQYGCDSSVTVHLVVIDSAFRLQLQLSPDGQQWMTDTTLYGCAPITVYLRDTTLFEQWRLWNFGDGDTLLQTVTSFRDPTPITHTYDSVGIYLITLTAESIHGCVDSTVRLRDAVRVYESPTADFSWEPVDIVMHDPWTRFLNASQPLDTLTFLWHFPSDGGIDTTSEASPRYEWPVDTYGDMEVRLDAIWTHVVDSSITVVCVDSVTYTVNIINEYLQFPNLVTPNGDGVNDRWVIANLLESGIYSMCELWIYDRTGAPVYHVRDIRRESDFWDPSRFPDGTYYYRFMAQSPYGLVKRYGTIEVVR